MPGIRHIHCVVLVADDVVVVLVDGVIDEVVDEDVVVVVERTITSP